MDEVAYEREDAESSPSLALSFGVVTTGILGILALVVALMIGLGKNDGSSSVAATGEAKTVEVMLAEFSVTPSTIDVPGGTDLTLRVTNHGTMAHDLAIEGAAPKVAQLQPGRRGGDPAGRRPPRLRRAHERARPAAGGRGADATAGAGRRRNGHPHAAPRRQGPGHGPAHGAAGRGARLVGRPPVAALPRIIFRRRPTADKKGGEDGVLRGRER